LCADPGEQVTTIGKTQTASAWSMAVTGTQAVTLTDATNDTITPGSVGISYTDSSGSANNTLDFAAGGKWAANGTGGTLQDLADSINAVETLVQGGPSTNASVTGNVLTVGTGSESLTIGSSAVETGTSVTSSTTGAVNLSQNASTDLTDKVKIPVSGTGSVTSLTVGNASDILSPGTNALQITAAGGSTTSLTDTKFAASGTGGNLSSLAAAINTQFGSAGVSATISGNTLKISGGALSQETGNTATEAESANTKSNQSVSIFTSDGTISQSYNNSASDLVQASSSALSLAGTDLTSTAGAQAALVAINHAITSVAAARGTIGANINTLTAVGNVMTTQSTNTLAAMNDVMATDYGQATSDMSKFQILSQTGIAALSQANQAQQLITKLLQ
jgi:flagellin